MGNLAQLYGGDGLTITTIVRKLLAVGTPSWVIESVVKTICVDFGIVGTKHQLEQPEFLAEWIVSVVRSEFPGPIAYDLDTRTGRVDMPAGCCVDMSTTIALFEDIDSHVERIDTYAGAVADTSYVRRYGRWIAYAPAR
jgi:hypothetical protein